MLQESQNSQVLSKLGPSVYGVGSVTIFQSADVDVARWCVNWLQL